MASKPLTPPEPDTQDPAAHAAETEEVVKADGYSTSADTTAYLTTRHSDQFGPRGWFVDLTRDEAGPHLASGLVVLPTDEQLASRRR